MYPANIWSIQLFGYLKYILYQYWPMLFKHKQVLLNNIGQLYFFTQTFPMFSLRILTPVSSRNLLLSVCQTTVCTSDTGFAVPNIAFTCRILAFLYCNCYLSTNISTNTLVYNKSTWPIYQPGQFIVLALVCNLIHYVHIRTTSSPAQVLLWGKYRYYKNIESNIYSFQVHQVHQDILIENTEPALSVDHLLWGWLTVFGPA